MIQETRGRTQPTKFSTLLFEYHILFTSQKLVCLTQIISREKKKKVRCKILFFKYFFISSIACCWPRNAQKWVLYKKNPLSKCPLYRIGFEPIFLELSEKISSRKLLTDAHGWSYLSPFWDDRCDFSEYIFTDTTHLCHVLFSRKYLIFEESQIN